jgi:hypothetical protein
MGTKLTPSIDVMIVRDKDGHVKAIDSGGDVICIDSPSSCVQEAINHAADGQSIVAMGSASSLVINNKVTLPNGKSRVRLILGEVKCNVSNSPCIFIDGHNNEVSIQSLLNIGETPVGLEATGHNHVIRIGVIGAENKPNNNEGLPWMFMDKAVYAHPPFDRDGYSGFLNVEVGSIHCGYRDADLGKNVAVCRGIVIEGNDERGYSIEGSVFTVKGSIRLAKRGLELGTSVFWDRFYLDIDPDLALGSDYLVYFKDGQYDCCSSPIRKTQPYRTQHEGAAFNTIDLYGWTPPETRKVIYFGKHVLGNRISISAMVNSSMMENKDDSFRNYVVNQAFSIQGLGNSGLMSSADGVIYLWNSGTNVNAPSIALSRDNPLLGKLEVTMGLGKNLSYYLKVGEKEYIVVNREGVSKMGLPVLLDCSSLPREGEYTGQVYVCNDGSKWRIAVWVQSKWIYLPTT